jgi:hypothetical protein
MLEGEPFDSLRSLRAPFDDRSLRSRSNGGEAGIRTLDTGFGPYNGLANRRLQPLGHLTVLVFLTISAIRRRSILLDGGFADHRFVNDSIPTRTTGGSATSQALWPMLASGAL